MRGCRDPRSRVTTAAMNRPKALQQYVGARVRALREARGWTQQQVASRVGLTSKYISEIERGLRDLPLSTLQRVVEDGLDGALVEVLPAARVRVDCEVEGKLGRLVNAWSRSDHRALEALVEALSARSASVRRELLAAYRRLTGVFER